jgi:DNA-binding response OmpR family regulator
MGNISKILVVDDDYEIGFMLKTILEHKGFALTVLNRTEHLEDVISRENFSLIILDMLIAGVNGMDVCSLLKKNTATSNIPVIMITALSDAETICIQGGADDFLSKPFEIDVLLLKVNNLIRPITN